MISLITDWILRMSLKWKLLLPFLILSFIGTTVLVYIGLRSQEKLIKNEELKELARVYQIFLTVIDHRETQALSLATMVAVNPIAEAALALRDREGLYRSFVPLYDELRKNFGIGQFHFHIPPAKSFLRLHMPEESGEMISYRREVIDAMKSGKAVSGLEWGLTGLGIRGVAPVYYAGELAGTVEIGFPFDAPFLDQLKGEWQTDLTVYEKRGEDNYILLATTVKGHAFYDPFPLNGDLRSGWPRMLISPAGAPDRSVLLGTVSDFYGETVALVQIEVDRSAIMRRLEKTRNLMFLVGGVGIILSFALTWLVAYLFVRPIVEIVHDADEIARGRREKRLKIRPSDEMGRLTISLNTMLDSLQARRREIANYARTLERKVQERTADLVSSEEKYRTLVENIPLIVYRLLDDGTTEFLNPYFTEKLGYSIEEAVGNKRFWWEKVCGYTGGPEDDMVRHCWEKGAELRVERVIKSRKGEELIFIDHAIPALDEHGNVKWVDGTMVDITELKNLQERTLQTEEIRVLGEISARFAHEIRNPLAIAGGFARRLCNAMSQDDPHYKFAQIIVEEVARLEDILQIILSSIEPFTLTVSRVDLNKSLQHCLDELEESIQVRQIHLETIFDPALDSIDGDSDLLHRAFECLLKHAVVSSPRNDSLLVATEKRNGTCVVKISHRAEGLGDEDLEQFFFPRITGKTGSDIKDLPLAKVIIHRHGGKVTVQREVEGRILLRIELPVVLPKPRGGKGRQVRSAN